MKEKQTILIVEDEMINRTILKKILSDDYEIIEAENGRKAWEILSGKNEISAILTDIVMPEMDGYELLDKIRQASLTELPLIVMTGESDAAVEQKVLDAGAWDFVSKPYNASILKSRLRNALARRQVSVYERMQKMAAHDPLTGLHNRNRMFEKTKKLLEMHPDVTFVFVRADIDHFALYNSAFGEEEGNRLLIYISKLFDSYGKSYELSAYGRINADVFAACVPYSGDTKAIEDVVNLTQKKLAEYNENYLLEISAGVYVINDPNISVEECYLRATLAAKTCKRQYNKHIGYYDESQGRKVSDELTISGEMEKALKEEQFVVYLQPKVNLFTDEVCGAEALVRWQHPEKGLISPGIFIPVFERNGFIAKLDHYMWEKTVQIIRGWMDQDITPMPISVNISRISLYNPQLVNVLVDLVEGYGIGYSYLQLEVTESAYMTNPELLKETIHDLRAAGFTILMDDFGSGYSSLNTLKEIEVDILKLDMKFLPVKKDVEKAEIILTSVIKMANWLGMPVVVEGVETRAQRDFLEGAGCDFVQGYFYAKPMPWLEYEANFVKNVNHGPEKKTETPKGTPLHNYVILIVDDDESDRAILSEYLYEDYVIQTCGNAEEALAYLRRNQSKVRLILTDNIMPGMSGMDFLIYCQDSPTLRMIPQIMITSNDKAKDQVEAFNHGAYDYITKPLIKEVVLARVRHVMEISRQYRSFENVRYDAKNQAELDQATGLLNKSAFNEIAAHYMIRYPDNGIALMVLDFDNFKSINDQYGHLTGDAVLNCLAKVLNKEFRKSDLLGRFGGDEFMVLMSGIPSQEIARRKASDMIKNVSIACAREEHVNASVSIGIAFREEQDSIEEMFSRANMALYEAKKTGKAKAVVYGECVPQLADDNKSIVLICSDDPQLYPSIALAYGDSSGFKQINSFDELKDVFEFYGQRIKAICLDLQRQHFVDSDDFYQYIIKHGGGKSIPIIAVCKEGNMVQMREAMKLDIEDFITIPPQMDVIQRKLSRAILAGCVE